MAQRLDNSDLARRFNIKVAQIDCHESPRVCERFGVESYPSLRVFESGKTYEYEGQPMSQDILNFLEGQAYRTSARVVDLAKNLAQETAKKAKEDIVKPTLDAWSRLKHFLWTRVFSMRSDSYLGGAVDWLFHLLGFGALSLSTKLVGFFMIIVVPMLLMLTMLFTPPGVKQEERHLHGKERIDQARAEYRAGAGL